MTIHYHGTPISPRSVLHTLAGRFFCVSYAAPHDVAVCHQIGQGVMLDNGAFSAWRVGKATDWPGYYAWAERWLEHHTTWAVIPDVIGGDEDSNDRLLAQWPHGTRGAPVWHLNGTIARLLRLVEKWPRVCIGSAAQYSRVGSAVWHARMTVAMNRLCGNGPSPVWLHMLRGMDLAGSHYPFASVDSTDVARNHHRPHNRAEKMAAMWDAQQNASRWTMRTEQGSLIDEIAVSA